MNILIIVDEPEDWPLQVPDVTIVAAQTYLTDPAFAVGHATGHDSNRGTGVMSRSVKLFNLCKSYRYQGSGYYVSLLAEARGHKPLPKVGAIEDLQSWNLVRHLTEDMKDLIQRQLAPRQMDDLELGVYFGRSTAGYDSLSHQLFNLLQVPLLSARFERHRNQWSLRGVRAIGAGDIPSDHQEFAVLAATEYFMGRRKWSKKHPPRFDLAILHDPDNPEPPSNAKALQKFKKAAEELSMRVEFVTHADIPPPTSVRRLIRSRHNLCQPLYISFLAIGIRRKTGGNR